MAIRKIQAKIPEELEEHIKKQPDYKSTSSYVKRALIKVSKFKYKKYNLS